MVYIGKTKPWNIFDSNLSFSVLIQIFIINNTKLNIIFFFTCLILLIFKLIIFRQKKFIKIIRRIIYCACIHSLYSNIIARFCLIPPYKFISSTSKFNLWWKPIFSCHITVYTLWRTSWWIAVYVKTSFIIIYMDFVCNKASSNFIYISNERFITIQNPVSAFVLWKNTCHFILKSITSVAIVYNWLSVFLYSWNISIFL